MKPYLIFGVFVFISRHKKTTATAIADEFEISTRTAYRYVEALSFIGVPVYTEQGRNGGIYIEENFDLDSFVKQF